MAAPSVPRPADYFALTRILLVPSVWPEPFGLVIAEAMACRRGLIASAAGGANEIIRDGVNALAHAPGNTDALAGLIARLANDPDLREKLGQAGRQTAERHFDRSRLGLQLAPIYRSILSARPAQAA